MTEAFNNNLVLLFRSPAEKGIDPYHKTLEDGGFTVASIPVLQFNFINLPDFERKLLHYKDYHSLIFTSQQAVRATQQVIESWTEGIRKELTDHTECYVVGKATGEAARHIGFKVKGEETGNASALCDQLLTEITAMETRPVLFPCSSIRKDTVVEKLSVNGIKVDEIKVYETGHRQEIYQDVQNLIQAKGLPSYIVFFSPSGVQAYNQIADVLGCSIKMIAIGPSTKAEMEQRGITVYGTAAKPDPHSVLNVLKNFHC